MIVADASTLVDLLLDRPPAAVTREALAAQRTIHGPHLLSTEVLHVLRRWTYRGLIPPPRAEAAVADLGALPIVFHAHPPLSRRVWALRDRLSAYDATYVALAEALEASLITADRRLIRAAAGLVDLVDAS